MLSWKTDPPHDWHALSTLRSRAKLLLGMAAQHRPRPWKGSGHQLHAVLRGPTLGCAGGWCAGVVSSTPLSPKGAEPLRGECAPVSQHSPQQLLAEQPTKAPEGVGAVPPASGSIWHLRAGSQAFKAPPDSGTWLVSEPSPDPSKTIWDSASWAGMSAAWTWGDSCLCLSPRHGPVRQSG